MIRRRFGERFPAMASSAAAFAFLASMLVLLFASKAGAAQADQRNAAYWYERAVQQLQRMGDEDWNVLQEYRENTRNAPSPRVRELLSRAAPLFNDLRRGSQAGFSDYGLDYSQGFEMTLPHLASLRQIARLAKTDAYVRMHDGDSYGAADRLATLYRVSEHLGDDRILISSLVGNAIFAFADEAVQEGFDRAIFNVDDAAVLLDGIQRIDPADPFDFMEAVAGEQTIAVSWLEQRFGDAENRTELLDWFTGPDGETHPAAGEIGKMSDDEFAAAIEEYDAVMDVTVNAFLQEDPEEGRRILQELDEQFENREHGPLTMMLIPVFSRVFESRLQAQQQLNQRLVMLEEIVAGRAKPVEHANAALFYAQAIEEYGKLEAETREQVEEMPDDPAKETALETQARLRSTLQPVIDLLREGSRKVRCDFAMLRPNVDLELCHDYIAGMHDMLRVLRVDAQLALQQAECEAVSDRFCIAYRAIAHLGRDEPLMSSVVAHDAFNAIELLADRFAQDGDLSEEVRHELATALEQTSFTDPFGYIGSLTWTRELLARPFRARTLSDEAEQRRLQEMVEAITGYDGDQLLYLLAVYDTLARDGAAEQQAAAPDPISRLTDVVDEAALRRVREDASFVAPMLAQDRVDFLQDRAVPGFANVVERMRRARSDLRQALVRWRPFSPTPASSIRSPDPSEEARPPA